MPKQRQRLPYSEIGFSLCRDASGKLLHGPVATGTHNAVDIPVSCPAGSNFVGLYHQHPGGVSTPSAVDTASAHKVGAKVSCIASDTEVRCARVRMTRSVPLDRGWKP